MKNLIKALAILSPSIAFANEGFNFLNIVAEKTGLEHIVHESLFNGQGEHHLTHIWTFALVGLFLVFVSLMYRSKTNDVHAAVIPDKGISCRNIVELYGSFIYSQAKAVLGEKDANKHYNYVATVFILILLSNMIGLIPGFLPPTETINTTLPFGVLTFLYFNFKGMQEQGVVNYFKHFAGPLWYLSVLIFPIEIISTCIRPVSLSLRLYGNMFGDHMVLQTFSGLAPALVPIIFMILGLLVCFIQAYVFTMLSMVYISLATAHQDHGEHHAHH